MALKSVFTVVCLLIFAMPLIGGEKLIITSPDKSVVLHFQLKDGVAFYSVSKNQQEVIDDSSIGFEFKQQPTLATDLRLVEHVITEKNAPWQRQWGPAKQVKNHYRQLVVTLSEKTELARKFKVVFRVFNDGLGFRYEFPEQGNFKQFEMTAENTEFAVTGNPQTWWTPQDFDSYEALYRQTPFEQVTRVNTPITMHTENGIFLSIHEAALTDYAGMTLTKKDTSQKLLSDLVPWPDGVKVRGETPFQTPWRTIQIADNAAGLMLSDLIENLNEPSRIADLSWIEPMKYVGIWWGMHMREHTWIPGPKHGATTERTKEYIDFAAANNIGGVLVEGWNQGWETWHTGNNIQDYSEAYPDFDLAAITQYAAKKGVTLIGHHETGGNIPMYEQQAERAFALYAKHGVRAVKTGYAGKMTPEGMYHHGQQMVNHYRYILELAAKNKIMLNVHEPIKATGIRRTYPNMLTREGGRGMEWNGWSEGNPPEHTLVLPFTRLLGGPMDYTPGIFNLKFDPQDQYRVHSTLARQLAHFVTLYSPMQMAADMIKNYHNQPAFEFIRQVPVDWDETRVIHAQIGDFLTVVRRNKDSWFVGSATDEMPRQLDIPLDFLSGNTKYKLTVFADAQELDYVDNPSAIHIASYIVTREDKLPAVLASGGGFAAIFTPVDATTEPSLPLLTRYLKHIEGRLEKFKQGSHYGQVKRVQHLAINQDIRLSSAFDPAYAAAGGVTLIDGVRGDADYRSGWQGYRQQNLDALIDLGHSQQVSTITIGFLQSVLHSILLPTKIIFEISTDGQHFNQVGIEKYLTRQAEPDYQRKDFSVTFATQAARYIRVKAVNPKTLPPWHIRPGQEAFIFADEIQVH